MSQLTKVGREKEIHMRGERWPVGHSFFRALIATVIYDTSLISPTIRKGNRQACLEEQCWHAVKNM